MNDSISSVVQGQLGHGYVNNLSILTRVEGLIGHFVSQGACGDYHTVVLTSHGCMWTFGSNAIGKTGHGITDGHQCTPKNVKGGFTTGPSKKVVFIAAGNHHSACTVDGSTYAWGKGRYSRLGHGDVTNCSSPKLVVNGLVGKKAKRIVSHSCTNRGWQGIQFWWWGIRPTWTWQPKG